MILKTFNSKINFSFNLLCPFYIDRLPRKKETKLRNIFSKKVHILWTMTLEIY